MKTNSWHIAMLLICVLTLLSCRKEKMAGTTNTDLLTQHAWKYNSFGIDENFDGKIDVPITLRDCQKDDIIRFSQDGTGAFDQNFNFCDPDFPKTESFTWQFLENETQLEYGGTVHTILALDETQLAIYTEENDGSTTTRYILNYRH